MGAALVLLLVGLACMAAGVLIGRYYVPDDRQLRRSARHARSYMKALSFLIARDHETVVNELRGVVEENIDDVEPYFALGALFRSRGELERAIRVHQALALRERDKRKVRQRAMYELGLDFRAAGMPRRATRAMEEVLLEDPAHEGGLRALAALYEEQGRFNESAGLWQRLGRRRNEDLSEREHHLLVAAAQAALGRDDHESAKQLLKQAQKLQESAHFFVAAAELAAARGNHTGAKERLKQALIADPALAPHLLPGLIAAEQSIDQVKPRKGGKRDELEDEDDARQSSPRLEAASVGLLGAGTVGESSSGTDSAAQRDADGSMTRVTTPSGGVPIAPGSVATPAGGVPVVSVTPAGGVPVMSGSITTPAGGGSASMTRLTTPASGVPAAGAITKVTTPALGVPLVPEQKPVGTVKERVLALLADIEAQTGPRLELALIRAQLVATRDGLTPAAARDKSDHEALSHELATKFPDALAARVATARLALSNGDERAVRHALDVIAGEQGMLAWALRGRWQCAHCGNRPGPFSWRCGQCRRWATLRMETGIEPPPVASRDRRASPRTYRPEGLLGTAPDTSLPAPTLDSALSEDELALAGTRRSLLGRVGGWFSGVWRRSP